MTCSIFWQIKVSRKTLCWRTSPLPRFRLVLTSILGIVKLIASGCFSTNIRHSLSAAEHIQIWLLANRGAWRANTGGSPRYSQVILEVRGQDEGMEAPLWSMCRIDLHLLWHSWAPLLENPCLVSLESLSVEARADQSLGCARALRLQWCESGLPNLGPKWAASKEFLECIAAYQNCGWSSNKRDQCRCQIAKRVHFFEVTITIGRKLVWQNVVCKQAEEIGPTSGAKLQSCLVWNLCVKAYRVSYCGPNCLPTLLSDKFETGDVSHASFE